jgi:hypothetical protein
MLTSSQRVKNWRQSTKTRIVEAMGNRCQICFYDKCNSALEFHHIDPSQKEFSFGKIVANPIKLDSILNELDKCILLCANCHREVHAGISDLPETYSRLDRSFFNFNSNGRSVSIIPIRDSCPVCGSEKSSTLSYCSNKCAAIMRRRVDWNSVDLIDLIEVQKIPMTTLGTKFGVSDNAVRKQYLKLKR